MKEFIAEQLKTVKKWKIGKKNEDSIWEFAEPILTTEDYEAIFRAYDISNVQYVPTQYLIEALKSLGVQGAEELIRRKYPDTLEDGHVNKVTFLYIVEEEHKLKGF